MANIYIDSALHETVDLYSSEFQDRSSTVISGLEPDWHTIRIEVSGTKSELSQNTIVNIDAFEILE